MLNDMIQLSHKLIAENKKDSKKEIVFQRLREAGRTSITEGDASAHLEPPGGTAWTTIQGLKPPPAGAAAAACAIAPLRRARSSSSCAEADGSATAAALPLQLIQLQKNVSRGFLTELSSCRSSRSSTQSRPAPHEADGPATTATPPAPHEADGSATAAAPPRGRHEEETPRNVIMHDAAKRGRERDRGSREGSRRRHGCRPGRGGVRGGKIMPPWKNRELSPSSSKADDSATAAAKLERAASSGPPSPAITAPPATPVRLRKGESPATPVNPDLQDGAATPDPTEYASSEELEPGAEPEAQRKSNPDIAKYVKIKKEMPFNPGHEAAPAPGCAPVTPSAHSLDSPAAVRTPSPALQESRYGMRTPTADEQADVEPDGATSPGLIPAEPAEVPSWATPTEVPSPVGTAVPPRGSAEQNGLVLNSRADQEPKAEQIPAPPGLAVHAIPAPAFLPLKNVELNFNLGEMETDPWFAHSHHDDLSAWQRRTTSQIHIQSFPTQPGMRYLRKTLTVDRCRQN